MRVFVAILALVVTAMPARAEPSLFAFTGFTRESLGYCMELMQKACDRTFGRCERGEAAISFGDRTYNVSLGCDAFPEIGAVVFGVSAASDGDTGVELRDRVLEMKRFIDSRL